MMDGPLHLNLVLLEVAGTDCGLNSGAGNRCCLQEKTSKHANTQHLPNSAPVLQGSWVEEEEDVGLRGTLWKRCVVRLKIKQM